MRRIEPSDAISKRFHAAMILRRYLIPNIVSPGSRQILDETNKILQKALIIEAIAGSCQSVIALPQVCTIPKCTIVDGPDNLHVQSMGLICIRELLLGIAGKLIIIKDQGKACSRH